MSHKRCGLTKKMGETHSAASCRLPPSWLRLHLYFHVLRPHPNIKNKLALHFIKASRPKRDSPKRDFLASHGRRWSSQKGRDFQRNSIHWRKDKESNNFQYKSGWNPLPSRTITCLAEKSMFLTKCVGFTSIYLHFWSRNGNIRVN